MEYFDVILASALPQIPYFLIDIVGIVIAFLRRKKNPKVSLMAGIYFSARLILSISGLGFTVLPFYLMDQGQSMAESSGLLYSVRCIICTPLDLILAVVLMFAIFGWREENKTGIDVEQKNEP
jgi:hypothetical protein